MVLFIDRVKRIYNDLKRKQRQPQKIIYKAIQPDYNEPHLRITKSVNVKC